MHQENPNKRFEIAAYCAIVILCGIAATALIQKFILTSPLPPPPAPVLSGTQVALDHDWTKSNKTLVLVLSETCRFCDESAPFYQKLTTLFPDNRIVQFVAVFPQEVNLATKHLSDLGVSIREIQQSRLSTLGVSGTPTLILVDAQGKVIESWVGKLSSADESAVIDRIRQ